ncbi:MAG: hypothetical protein ACRBHB_06130 [Arenicella sp.]
METVVLDEVIACLPQGKTHYRYYKNAYAPKLLSLLLNNDIAVKELQQSAYAKLLHNVVLKDLLANCGDGIVHLPRLNSVWQEPSLPFLLTVDKWSYYRRGWSQVSRHGDNLVLQLNLPKQHQVLLEKYMGKNWSFNPYYGHPVRNAHDGETARDTLAWARIDLDFSTDEALIEEIQSDGAREMMSIYKRAMACSCRNCQDKQQYLRWFEPYLKIWPETMLMAAVEFIRKELGISKVFMHTARSGWRVKQMDKQWAPPVSLYSDLPKKFVFRQVWNAPEFLLRTRTYQQVVRREPDIDFYELDFSQHYLKHKGGSYANKTQH